MSAREAFRKLVSEAACKVLTIKDLQDLDDAEITPKYAMGGLIPKVESKDEAA